jgi:hypothetical protein
MIEDTFEEILSNAGITKEDYKSLSSLVDRELALPKRKRRLLNRLMRPYHRPGVSPKERLIAKQRIMEEIAPLPKIH